MTTRGCIVATLPPAACRAAVLVSAVFVGCSQSTLEPYKPLPPAANSGGVVPEPLPTSVAPSPTLAPSVPPQLLGAPFLFRPTAEAFGVNVLLRAGSPESLLLRVRAVGAATWGQTLVPNARAIDVAEWEITGLQAGTRYEYQVLDATSGSSDVESLPVLYSGFGTTQRPSGTAFSFALLSDSHIGYDITYYNQGDPTVLSAVGEQIAQLQPDFLVNLGDLIDFHQFGFNAAPPDGSITRGAYVNYRESIGDALGLAAHFNVIGNWEGENGNYSPETIQWSRDARMAYMPGPNPNTYPLGGSPWQDYYAFTWGDATFFVLNVMTYTPTEHLLSTAGGDVDDWTLGVEQMAWFQGALQASDSRWKFVLIHHAVGGKAGDEANARYGRGGGLAAEVGEQAVVHRLMQEHGVQIFFYGHDHVFVDMTVDGVHYTQPGSAGAPWKFTTDETGYTEYWSESGWGRVDVSAESVAVTFLSSLGAVLYEYSLE